MEKWRAILDSIKIDNNSSENDVINEIKEKLRMTDLVIYQELCDDLFNINHLFNIGNIPPYKAALLHVAVELGKEKVVEALLKVGADFSIKNGEQKTPLHLAAKHGHIKIATLLMDQEVNNKSWLGKFNLVARIIKAIIGSVSIINMVDKDGMTPLYFAILNDHAKMVELLIDRGAVPRIADNQSWEDPLSLAFESDSVEVIKILARKGDGFHRKHPIVEALVSGFSVNRALTLAVSNGCIKITKFLIEKMGADVAKHQLSYIIRGYNLAEQDLFFHNMYHYHSPQNKELIKLLVKYALLEDCKMNRAEYVAENDLHFNGHLSEHWNECLNEIEKMKAKKVVNGITLYDILVSKDVDRLMSYGKKNIAEALYKYKEEFPKYVDKIKSQYQKIIHRADELCAAGTIIEHFYYLNRKRGAGDVSHKIASYLGSTEIQNLREAAVQTIDKSTGRIY